MIFKLWRYAYGGAKVMALKSFLLSPEDYHYLLRARNLEDLVGYLRTTAYGPTLSGWDWRRGDAEAELSRRLYGSLAQAFLKVRRGLKPREARFLDLLLERLEAENLKVVLRALNLRLDPVQAEERLLPLTALSSLNFQAMLRQESIPRLVDYLAPTVWGPPLARGLSRFAREANLFPLEMSLDLFVYASLWQGLARLGSADRRIAGEILGTLADITNITWAGRFRDLYGFPAEETYQYLIEAGSFRSPAARRDLAFAANTGEMILRLPRPSYIELLQGAADRADVEARLRQHWLATLERALARPPFQIGLPVTYLFFKELELDNLVTLVTGKMLNLPAERVEPWLWRRAAGGVHV
ncbi:MAG: V-type ATPase subunit [Desulfobaccales bacterium]